jgi:hypothetical protein
MALLALYLAAIHTLDGGVPQVLLLQLIQPLTVAIVDNPRMLARAMHLTAVLQTLEDRERPRVVPAENYLPVVELNALGDQTCTADPRDIFDPI